jgi:shikimate kinase
MATLWLIGMMGSGKSTVGSIVARRLGLEFVDLDTEIEEGGVTIPQIFAASGEDAFRDLEEAAIARVAGSDVVVASGGGAVVRPGNVTRMRETGTVVWLDAGPDTLAARVGAGEGRPLLAGDAVERLRLLAVTRAAAYRAAAHARVATDGVDPEQVAARVIELWTG